MKENSWLLVCYLAALVLPLHSQSFETLYATAYKDDSVSLDMDDACTGCTTSVIYDVECDQIICRFCITNGQGQDCSFSPTLTLDNTGVINYRTDFNALGIPLESFQVRNSVSAPSQVNINVLNRDLAPTTVDAVYTVVEGESIEITLGASDPDTLVEDLNYYVTSLPIEGTLFMGGLGSVTPFPDPLAGAPVNTRVVTYEATSPGFGEDYFFFAVYDSVSSSDTYGMITIEVLSANPSGADQLLDAEVSVPLNFDLEITESTNSATIVLTLGPFYGTLSQGGNVKGLNSQLLPNNLVYELDQIPSMQQTLVDYIQYAFINNLNEQVGEGSVTFVVNSDSALVPEIAFFLEINGSKTTDLCVDLKSAIVSLGGNTIDQLDFYLTILPNFGQVSDNCTESLMARSYPRAFTPIDSAPYQLVEGNFVYKADDEQPGLYTDVLEWQVVSRQNNFASDYGIVYINIVDDVNEPPVAINSQISMRQDTVAQIYLTGYDLNGDEIVPYIVSTTAFCPQSLGKFYQDDGTDEQILCDAPPDKLVLSPEGTILFEPTAEYFTTGTEASITIQFYMKETAAGGLSGLPASVGIFVNENQIPTARPGNFTGNEDELLVIDRSATGWGTDPDGDPLITIITRPPQKGEIFQYAESNGVPVVGEKIVVFDPVQLTDPLQRMIFKPRTNAYNTPYDAFSFQVSDDLGAFSNEQRITVNILPVPDVPTARNITLINQNEDTFFTISLLGDDPDGGSLTSQVVSLPTLGNLYQFSDTTFSNPIRASSSNPVTVTDPEQKVVYKTLENQWGPDSFTFRVTDSMFFSTPGFVFVTIVEVNDPPVVYDQVVNVEFAGEILFTLRVTDVDNDPRINGDGISERLFAVVQSLPQAGVLFQVTDGVAENFGDIVQTPTTVSDLENQLVFKAVNFNVEPSTTYNFAYTARDERKLASLDFANITLVVSEDNTGQGGGGIGIGVIAGVIVGFVFAGGCCALAFMHWRKKRAARRKNLQFLLYNQRDRKGSAELLQKLLMEEDMAVAIALAESIPNNELDDLGEALVRIFETHGMTMALLKVFIRDEVQNSEDPATLFRGNSIASKFMKAYSKLIGIPYLAHTLMTLTDQVLANVGSYEVDPRKLKEGEDMDANWVRLNEISQQFLDAFTESIDACPMEFRELSQFLLQNVQEKYPDYKNAITFVGGFIFLRFFCPAMVAPEGYRLVDKVPSLEERRGLVLVSKAIQNLSNGVQFGAKEAFMMPMNEFIVRNLHQTRQFLEQLSALPDADPLDESERARLQEPITLEMRMEAVETCHRLLFVNQQGVIENLQGSTDVQDLEDIKKPLNDYNRLVELHHDDWKEVSKIIVKNPAIIRAFCASIQTAEVAQSLITVFEASHCTLDVLKDLIEIESQESKSNPNMILRGNGTAFKMLKGYVEIIGLFYLQQTLGMVVKFVCNNPEGFEIDPDKCEPGTSEEEIEENVQKLTEAFNEFWSQITTSAAAMPPQIRVLCKHLFDNISVVCPEKRYSVTGDFIFNRMLGPAIVSPVSYGLMDEEPSPTGRRALILITKVILNVVHNLQVYQKEPYLNSMSHVVVECADSFQAFIDEVVDLNNSADSMQQAYEITPDLLEESVLTVHRQMQDDRTRGHMTALLTPDIRETGSLAERLEAILKDLGLPQRKQKKPAVPGRIVLEPVE